MYERTELTTPNLQQCIEWARENVEGGWSDVISEAAADELAALQSAAQGVTLDDARKVLPAGEWRRERIETAKASDWYSPTYGQFTLFDYGKISAGWLTTVDDVNAARCLELAMQGDSAAARTLREEYAG